MLPAIANAQTSQQDESTLVVTASKQSSRSASANNVSSTVVSAPELSDAGVTASDKRNVIKVDAATLVNPGNAAAVAQSLYNYYMKRQTQKIRIVMNGERPGDHVAAPTPWDTMMDGFITSMQIVLSGIAAAECSIAGVDVKAVGGSEEIASGEVMSGEV